MASVPSFVMAMDSRVAPTARAPSAPPTVVEGLEKKRYDMKATLFLSRGQHTVPLLACLHAV